MIAIYLAYAVILVMAGVGLVTTVAVLRDVRRKRHQRRNGPMWYLVPADSEVGRQAVDRCFVRGEPLETTLPSVTSDFLYYTEKDAWWDKQGWERCQPMVVVRAVPTGDTDDCGMRLWRLTAK